MTQNARQTMGDLFELDPYRLSLEENHHEHNRSLPLVLRTKTKGAKQCNNEDWNKSISNYRC